jgi:hypothetical protein
MQRHTNQMPAWLMSSGAGAGVVGAIVKKHAENIGELIGLLRAATSEARRGRSVVARAGRQNSRLVSIWPASRPFNLWQARQTV